MLNWIKNLFTIEEPDLKAELQDNAQKHRNILRDRALKEKAKQNDRDWETAKGKLKEQAIKSAKAKLKGKKCPDTREACFLDHCVAWEFSDYLAEPPGADFRSYNSVITCRRGFFSGYGQSIDCVSVDGEQIIIRPED